MRILNSFEPLEQRRFLANDVLHPIAVDTQSVSERDTEVPDTPSIDTEVASNRQYLVALLVDARLHSASEGALGDSLEAELDPDKPRNFIRLAGADTVASAQRHDEVLVPAFSTQPGAAGNDTLLAGEGEDSVYGAWHDVFVRDTVAREHLLNFAWDDTLAGTDGNDGLSRSETHDVSHRDDGSTLR